MSNFNISGDTLPREYPVCSKGSGVYTAETSL